MSSAKVFFWFVIVFVIILIVTLIIYKVWRKSQKILIDDHRLTDEYSNNVLNTLMEPKQKYYQLVYDSDQSTSNVIAPQSLSLSHQNISSPAAIASDKALSPSSSSSSIVQQLSAHDIITATDITALEPLPRIIHKLNDIPDNNGFFNDTFEQM